MQPTIIYNVFVRDFRKQKKRITLTLVALAWGTISIMLLLGFGQGLQEQLTINQKGMGEGIIIIWGGSTSLPFKGLGRGRSIDFTAEDVDFIRQRMPELKYAAGEYSRWGATVKYKDKVLNEHITGIYPNYKDMRNHIPEQGGRMIDEIDMVHKRRVVFLGDDLAKRLFGSDDPIGKKILIADLPFTVIGVMVHKMQMGAYGGMDEDKASIPATTFATAYGYRYFNNLVIAPKDPSKTKAVKEHLAQILGAKYKFDPKDDKALWIWDAAEGQRQMTNMLLGVKIFLGIVGALTLLIAGVGVANIMYVSIKERTREIGIKMAVGARRSYILAQFLVEALIITFFGGLGGMSVSYILTEAFKRIPIKSDVLDFMGRPTISLEIGLIVIAILGVMGILSGFFPALKAASVSPVESLRYE